MTTGPMPTRPPQPFVDLRNRRSPELGRRVPGARHAMPLHLPTSLRPSPTTRSLVMRRKRPSSAENSTGTQRSTSVRRSPLPLPSCECVTLCPAPWARRCFLQPCPVNTKADVSEGHARSGCLVEVEEFRDRRTGQALSTKIFLSREHALRNIGEGRPF